MTLFGVGFKVEAKAAVSPISSITYTDLEWNYDVDDPTASTETDLTIGFSFDDAVLFASDTPIDVDFTLIDGDDNPVSDTTTLTFTGGTDPTITPEDKRTWTKGGQNKVTNVKITGVDADDIHAAFGTGHETTLTIIAECSTYDDGTKAYTISEHKVELKAVNTVSKKDITDSVTFSPNVKEFYLLDGEKKTITAPETVGGLSMSKWTEGNTTLIQGRTITVKVDGAPRTITANYDKTDSGITIENLEGASVLANKETGHTVFKYSYAAGTYTGLLVNNIDSDKGVTIDGTPVGYGSDATYFWFNVPNSTGTKTLKFTTIDGIPYSYSIRVIKSADDVKLKFNPSSATIGIGSTKKLALEFIGAEPDEVEYTYTPASPTCIEDNPDEEYDSVTVKGKAAGSVKITATGTYKSIAGIPTFTRTADVTVKVETLQLKDAIYVNKDKKVTLSDFIKSGSSSSEISSIINNADSYIEIEKSSNAVKDIKIKGKSSGTKDDSLIVDDYKIDVTVYPEPKLSVETTGAGSSYKQTYTVKMPKGVYHDKKDDGWWIESLSKAKLVFKASSNSDKTREVTVDSFSDSNSSDEKLMKKATKELKTSDLNVIFRDLCKNDSDTISVIAYPYNTNKDKIDTEIASEKKEFTVYKITMDTSGGANYTVNGESVSDYFYGIDGVTYEIKSSGKTANAKLNKDTSSSEFGSGETIQYKVAGARTLKAVYGGGSNNEGGGGNMDDYDDVPKTGESKADIWILWSVLFIAILGAGFMIWKRFGLVRAIAAAEEEYAIAEEEERIETEKKEKEDKLNMLKDLRNL